MPKELFIWAHRGASAAAPENTLAAFRLAETVGADGIELDVHLSRDGVPVVIHDETVDRTSSGRGPVRRLTRTALRRLDAGSWFSPAFAGEPIPDLRETLDWAGDRLRLNIEIKSAGAGEAVLALLSDFPEARVLVSSFDHRLLENLRLAAPDLPLGFLVDSRFWRQVVAAAERSRAESLHPRQDLLSPLLAAACRRAGLAIYPWTVDDRSSLRRLQRQRVDGVFTNCPGELRQPSRQRFSPPSD